MNKCLLPKIIVLCGPTASGKSDLALRLAPMLNAEIVNADSLQVYRGLNIGTAKPSTEQLERVPHHLIDIVEPDQQFTAADFAAAASRAITDITGRGKRALVVGGTGLYIRALVKGLVDSPGGDEAVRSSLQAEAELVGNEEMLERLRRVDPELAATLHPNNLVRIIRALEVFQLSGIPLSRHQQQHGFAAQYYETLQIGVSVPREILYQRIEERVELMVSAGLSAEVKGLLDAGYSREQKALRSIGYKEIASYLYGEISLDDAIRLIKRNTRHYAKRQLTWFRADPDILWFEYPEKFVTITQYAIEFFARGEA